MQLPAASSVSPEARNTFDSWILLLDAMLTGFMIQGWREAGRMRRAVQ
jgi:hypothetical protein